MSRVGALLEHRDTGRRQLVESSSASRRSIDVPGVVQRTLLMSALALATSGCGREFLAMDPAGEQSERIATLTWFMVITGTVVYVVVIGFLLYASYRGSRRADSATGDAVEHQLRWWVGGGVAVTTVILLVLLGANFGTGRALASYADPDALVIRVVGKQWWWEIEYLDPRPDRRVVTANEIHIPVGRRIRIETESHDVIHSFWAPNLHGKIDVIPGYRATTYLQADRPGVYDGRCAEFCGHQHAHMNFLVIAQPPEEFARWYEAQLRPAPPPADSMAAAGQEVFLSRGCVLCHTVRGTPAGSRFGPDLTHVASRRTLAAGTIPNTRGHLAGWVVDPQRIKPFVQMPPNALSSAELHALLAFLEGLR